MYRPTSLPPVILSIAIALAAGGCDALLDPGGSPSPEILLQTLQPDLVIDADSLVVEGMVRDSRPVTQVSYRLTGGESRSLTIVPALEVPIHFVLRGLEMGEHELEVTAVNEAEQTSVERRSFRVADLAPPSLTVVTPQDGGILIADSVLVEALATDERGVDRLTHRLNGGEIHEIAVDPAHEVTFEFVVRGLQVGSNILDLVAYDVGGNPDSVRLALNLLDEGPAGPLDPSKLWLRPVTSGLVRPLHLAAPTGDPRLFIVEQPGRVRVFENGTLLATPFLDLTAQVRELGEQGMLGLAFHPDYARNGFFYVYYIDLEGNTRVERYRASSDRNRADPASAKLILHVQQPTNSPNHKAGTLTFGPDGMLYVALGDGAAARDHYQNAQNPGTLLGAVLRIDVDGGNPYAIPPDNPLVGVAGARGEVWAYGLRNPWRISVDRLDGTVFIPDVGEDVWEEINVVSGNGGNRNFGWPVMEGPECFPNTTCDPSPFVPPTFAYTHAEGCSVTGGFVYRGRLQALRGHYVYSDFCSGSVRSFRHAGGQTFDHLDWNFDYKGLVTAIGEDGAGDLYLITRAGAIFRIEPRPPS